MSFGDPEHFEVGPDYLDPADVDAYDQIEADAEAELRDVAYDEQQAEEEANK